MYKAYVHYRATWASGKGVADKGPRTGPVEGVNNVGTYNEVPGKPGFLGEGGPLSSFVNRIPGANAVAGFHDEIVFHLSGFARDILNVPTMPVAVGLTVPALLAETPGLLAVGPQYFGCPDFGRSQQCGQ